MNHKNPDDVTFQVTGKPPLTRYYVCVSSPPSFTVGQLTLSPYLTEQDIRVTVCIGEVSKITCSGLISMDGLTVTWNHPFLLQVSFYYLGVCMLIYLQLCTPLCCSWSSCMYSSRGAYL